MLTLWSIVELSIHIVFDDRFELVLELQVGFNRGNIDSVSVVSSNDVVNSFIEDRRCAVLKWNRCPIFDAAVNG